jgi:hypothetical protein
MASTARHPRREQQATIEPIGRDVVIAIPGWRFEGCVLRAADDDSVVYRLALWTRAAITAAGALGLLLALTAQGHPRSAAAAEPPQASQCRHIAPHCHLRQHAVCICADANQLHCDWICSY